MVDVVGLLRLLLLIGRSALDPAHGRDGHQDPGELLHLGAMALHKEGALVRVEAQGNEGRGHLARLAPELLAVVHAGKGVVIDDAVDGLVVLLQRHVIADGAQVVPQVRRPARLDPRIGADRLLAHRGECSGAGERRTPSARIAATEGALLLHEERVARSCVTYFAVMRR